MTETTLTYTATDQDHLRAIVRGETHWSEPERLGVHPVLDVNPALWEEPPALPVVSVRAEDLALGFCSHAGAPTTSREWAQVIELCGCFDLAPIEAAPSSDLLLDAVWSASFGDPIDDRALDLIHQMAFRPALAGNDR